LSAFINAGDVGDPSLWKVKGLYFPDMMEEKNKTTGVVLIRDQYHPFSTEIVGLQISAIGLTRKMNADMMISGPRNTWIKM
jgi:hypothetical protein